MTPARVARNLAALALLATALPTVALGAEPPAEVSLADRETARSLMKTGDAKFRAGDFAGALDDYRAADRLVAVPSTRLAVGKAQMEMGLLLQARDTLLGARRMPVAPDESDVLTRAREEAASLAQQIADRIPSMNVRPKGLAAGVKPTVVIDGQHLPPELVGVTRKVDPGTHHIVAMADGYSRVVVDVELAERETQTVELAFVADGSGADPAPEGASASAGPTPEPVEGPSNPAAADSSEGLSPVVWAGLGVGAVGLVVGVIAGGVAASRAGDLEEACPESQCPRATTESDYDAAYAAAHASTVGFVLAGVGLAVGLVGLALPGPATEAEPAGSSARVRVRIGAGSLGLEGSF